MLNIGFNPPAKAIAFVITALLAFAYHEFAHAIVADRMGDPTPRSYGRITLNPIVHLDRFGTILLLLFGFGWASTPVSPNRLRGNPRTSMAVVALAGPAANLLMAAIFALPLILGLVQPGSIGNVIPTAFGFLWMGIYINILLMVFNLLPIPPLDGFTILLGLLPAELAYQLAPLRQYGLFILMIVIFLLPVVGINVIGAVLNPIMNTVVSIILR